MIAFLYFYMKRKLTMNINPNYSDRAIAVQGNIDPYLTDLVGTMGGLHNKRLVGGPGVIFSKKKLGEVQAYIMSKQGNLGVAPVAAVMPVVAVPVRPVALTPTRIPIAVPSPQPIPQKPTSSLKVTEVPNVLTNDKGVAYQLLLLTVPLLQVGYHLTTARGSLQVTEVMSSFDARAKDDTNIYSCKLVGDAWTVFYGENVVDMEEVLDIDK